MKTLFIHIGPPKTGSTTIQNFLHEASEQLSSQGILYPLSGRTWNDGERVLNRDGDRRVLNQPLTSHLVHGYVLRGHIEGKNADRCWRDLVREMAESDAQRLVLSGEIFGNLELEHVKRIGEYLADFDVQVIGYIREPFARVLSQYTQRIKTGRGSESFRSFLDWRLPGLLAEYEAPFSSWSNVFGEAHLIVKDFDGILASGVTLEKDFLLTVHADPDAIALVQTKSSNESPRPGVVRVLRIVNAIEAFLGKRAAVSPWFARLRARLVKVLSADEGSGSSLGRFALRLLRPFGRPLFDAQDRARIERSAGDAYRACVKSRATPSQD